MKKTNLTFFSKLARPWILAFGLMLLSWSFTTAQCSLGCNYSIQVSLDDEMCEALVTPADLLTDSTNCEDGYGMFYVELRHNGVLLPLSPTITSEFVGKTIEAKVIDGDSGNSCWGYISVEDKLAPIIDCPDVEDVVCSELPKSLNDIIDMSIEENCGLYTINILDSITVTDCDVINDPEIIRKETLVYQAIDESNNVSKPCTIMYDVLRIPDLDSIKPPMQFLLPNDNLMCTGSFPKLANGAPDPSFSGYPTLDGKELKPGIDEKCNLIVKFTDEILKDEKCIKKYLRTWSVIEWSCDARPKKELAQRIDIAHTIDPVLKPGKDITVSTTPHHCDALATIPPIEFEESACADISVTISGGMTQIVGNGGETRLPVGINTITYLATDHCGNSATTTIKVTVKDLTPPVTVCDQNTTVSVTTDGLAWVPAEVFDDGSYDECHLDRLIVRRMQPDTCSPCQTPQFDDFKYLGTIAGSHFYASTWPSNQHVAKKYAKSLGGTLAVVNTKEKADFVDENMDKYFSGDEYYIGLERVGDTNDFKWIDHTELTYSNWDSHQPSNYDGANAVFVDGGEWYDTYGDGDFLYVVEIKDVCGFSEYTKFCCNDVGDDRMVVLRAIDRSGNYNDCMVNVEVQDKLAPTIHCPDNLQLTCSTYYDSGNLIDDYGPYQYFDNCEKPTIRDIITVDSVNQCNVGYKIREITATDAGGRSATCKQRITISPETYDFERIDFPDDVTMNTCADPTDAKFSPDSLGRPDFIGDNQCNLLGADYDDYVYTFNNSNGEACFKIIRRWTVIDWCNHDGYTYHDYPAHDQVIVVNDLNKPTITSSCERKNTCTYDNTCTDGFIELTATANDDEGCTNVLDYFWKIDVNNNGTFEGGYYKNQPLSGSGSANEINASGTYPIGSHRIQYSFVDKCGNVTTCDQLFDIINCKAPTPYCHNGLAVDLMPQTGPTGEIIGGMVELWANDFDAGSFHTCPGYKVYVSFSENILDTGRVFTCLDEGRATVLLYASVITPMGDTLSSYCETFVDVQDNMNACDGDDGMRVGVFGNLNTPDGRDLSMADVALVGVETEIVNSNEEGFYTFGEMPTGGQYTVVPTKNDDHMNGVSTLDLVLMQRHILNIQELPNAYNVIAADVNKDGKVSAADLVELRKLILGVSDSFENNDSWRFIDASTDFPQGVDPLTINFEETYIIDALSSDMEIDFNSVKIGDVNGSAKSNIRSNDTEPRSSKTVEITIDNNDFVGGESVDVVLNTNSTKLSGAQFTISFDANKLSFEGVAQGDMDVDESNFGLRYISEGLISFSWNSDAEVNANQLFTMKFTATHSGDINNSIGINSVITTAEAYDINNEVMNIEFRTESDDYGLVLYQNVPNPFNDNTTVSFNMPKEANATLSILDVTGKTIYSNTSNYTKGMNSIQINKVEHNLSGVMYYQLTVDNNTLVKKMVIIE